MKNKKLMLVAVAAMGLVAAGTAGVGTAAWFQAESATQLAMTNSDTKEMTVGYTQFGTSVGNVAVTLTFEEQTSSKVLGLVTYLASDPDEGGPKVAGWNQCYRTEAGTEVWNSNSAPTNAYGTGANAYYRVYKIKATWHPSANQVASTIADHVINGKVTVSDSKSEGSGKIWLTTTAPNTDGKTSTPASAPTTAATSFVKFDIGAASSWTADADNTAYSTSYVCVMIDGAVHTTNDAVTATIGFDNVSVSNS